MKKLKLTIIGIALLCGSITYAQSDSTAPMGFVVKADLYSVLSDVQYSHRYLFSASIEHFISKRIGIQLTSFFGTERTAGTYMDITYTQHLLQFAPELKYYFGETDLHKGFFAGGYFLYGHYAVMEYNVQPTDQLVTNYISVIDGYNLVGGGIVAGVQYYIKQVFSIEVQFGLGAGNISEYYASLPDEYNPSPAYKLGITATGFANINVGYKF